MGMWSQLKSLDIYRCNDPDRIAGISHSFCRLPRLQSLSVEAVSTDAYIQLSNHPELTNLKLGSLRTIDWDIVENNLQGMSAFPSLEGVEVDFATETQCRQLLQTMRSSLRSIEVLLWDIHTGTSYCCLLTALKDHCPSMLQKISLGSYLRGANFTPSADPITPDHLTPLLGFRNLTHLNIRPSSDIQVDENCIQKMTENLPRIRTFLLLSHNSDPDVANRAPTLKIDCLVHFALNCPHLTELGLAFDARWAALPYKAARRPTLHPTSLNLMYVGNSPVRDTYTVAAIFSDWFPKIYTILAGPLPGKMENGPKLQRLQKLWDNVGNSQIGSGPVGTSRDHHKRKCLSRPVLTKKILVGTTRLAVETNPAAGSHSRRSGPDHTLHQSSPQANW
ncbi:hypothetical protein BDN72DRAFT_843862 [Pluteus cervinus]|uniref:Uncharacterized protein n=1 Tax=Pluteus cervinus TaxID=181527 RepID=A0ACD3ALY5_9AGAR|nr:hypothetical protein BDN72DRAFT_843862 [Pluteus cervinus]